MSLKKLFFSFFKIYSKANKIQDQKKERNEERKNEPLLHMYACARVFLHIHILDNNNNSNNNNNSSRSSSNESKPSRSTLSSYDSVFLINI